MMVRNLIDLVANLVKESECVPLPGGHGTRFPDTRSLMRSGQSLRCTAYPKAPGCQARAYICLALLGKRSDAAPAANAAFKLRSQPPEGQLPMPIPPLIGRRSANEPGTRAPEIFGQGYFGRGGEKWHGGQWLGYSTGWFEQRLSELTEAGRTDDATAIAKIDRRHRWRYLLHALAQLGANCEHLTDRQRVILRDEWLTSAVVRLEGLIQKWHGEIMPPPLFQIQALEVQPVGPAWKTVADVLDKGDFDSRLAQAAYFMHVMHARAGLWQVELDDGNGWLGKDHMARRRAFHAGLLNILSHFNRCAPYFEATQAIADSLRRLHLFNPEPSARAEPLTKHLPACFGPYQGLAAAHFAELDPNILGAQGHRTLAVTFHIAELVADLLIDPFHVRSSRYAGPGFTFDDYTYADSRARYRQNTTLPDNQSTRLIETVELVFRRDMASYFGQMKQGRMFELIQLHLRDVHLAQWPSNLSGQGRCAACHIQAH